MKKIILLGVMFFIVGCQTATIREDKIKVNRFQVVKTPEFVENKDYPIFYSVSAGEEIEDSLVKDLTEYFNVNNFNYIKISELKDTTENSIYFDILIKKSEVFVKDDRIYGEVEVDVEYWGVHDKKYGAKRESKYKIDETLQDSIKTEADLDKEVRILVDKIWDKVQNEIGKFTQEVIQNMNLAIMNESKKEEDMFKEINIETEPKSMAIEVNDEYIGLSPISVRLETKGEYLIKAIPRKVGTCMQTKILQGEKLPRKIFFQGYLNCKDVDKDFRIRIKNE